MEVGSPSSPSVSDRHEGSTYDELSMQQSIMFSDCLKDLKTLRLQLYSAAEYFEQAYTKDDQKQLVVDTLKDYAVKALVNTVDHLGSVSFKVTNILEEKICEVSETELQISSIEQRIHTCQDCMDQEGLAQQSSIITAPKYYKRYILQGGSMPDAGRSAVPNYRELQKARNNTESHQHPIQLQESIPPKTKEKLTSFSKLRSIRRIQSQRARSTSPHSKANPSSPKTTKPSIKDARSVSPLPNQETFNRSVSVARKPSLLKSSSVRSQQYPSDPQKLASLLLHSERDDREAEHTPKKNKKFLKALLSRRKSRKDETLNNYLDEY
ncbi:hypothetical protein LUZ61_005688 [Rhynchospora tenuis]|uniref:Uncharacterized protein n=1 Tax=Rhynchospora tenuis TaxID=198213 RepID=A0AAD6EUW2_9POAL|nr:hypothetical protein LUZ61_005688 [Rhynchospora tenuis]